VERVERGEHHAPIGADDEERLDDRGTMSQLEEVARRRVGPGREGELGELVSEGAPLLGERSRCALCRPHPGPRHRRLPEPTGRQPFEIATRLCAKDEEAEVPVRAHRRHDGKGFRIPLDLERRVRAEVVLSLGLDEDRREGRGSTREIAPALHANSERPEPVGPVPLHPPRTGGGTAQGQTDLRL
jgi:hypothetical protein